MAHQVSQTDNSNKHQGKQHMRHISELGRKTTRIDCRDSAFSRVEDMYRGRRRYWKDEAQTDVVKRLYVIAKRHLRQTNMHSEGDVPCHIRPHGEPCQGIWNDIDGRGKRTIRPKNSMPVISCKSTVLGRVLNAPQDAMNGPIHLGQE